MIRCVECGQMKYYTRLVKITMDDQEKHTELCYRCLSVLGFKLPHSGD